MTKRYEVWLIYEGIPEDGIEAFSNKVDEFETEAEAQARIDATYGDGRYHAEIYEIRVNL